MRVDHPRCGGFFVVWLDDRPSVRLVPGNRRLDPEVPKAVVDALSAAPAVLSEALHVRAPARPWERVEVSIAAGSRTEGEALSLGSGSIRLSVGEEAGPEDAAAIARHEAVHLLLAATLRGAEKWCDPELAFSDWIVRGIEGRLAPAIPRFRAPLPGLLDPVPASRVDVQRHLASSSGDAEAGRSYFGGAPLDGGRGSAAADPDRRLADRLRAIRARRLQSAAWGGAPLPPPRARLEPRSGGPPVRCRASAAAGRPLRLLG